MANAPLLEMRNIKKDFFGNQVLTDINLKLGEGEVLGLVGENGAGKSTLMKILFGAADISATGGYGGEIFLNGQKVSFASPFEAIEAGIGMVHQEFSLIPGFDATENILLNREPKKGNLFAEVFGDRLDTLDRKDMDRRAEQAIDKMGVSIDRHMTISSMPVGHKQFTEIARELSKDQLKLLILDEPTAVLTEQEIDELLHIMKNLIEDGKTIIIITHKLKEIQASSDECTIIRRGQYIDTVPVKGITEDELAEKMVGRSVNLVVDTTPPHPGEVVLDIQGLYVKNEQKIDAVKDFNLQVRAGEIVGIAGIDGNGQTELMDAVNNLRKCSGGKILLCGEEIQNKDPKYGIDRGLATIPADRHKDGLVLTFSVYENTILKKYRTEEFSPGGQINRKKMKAFANELIREYDVRPEDCGPKQAGGLSGGNQQKVIIGREIANDPKLLIAIQPTRGLDVGAIENVHKMLIRERDKGVAVLLVSYELDEVMNVSDRIAVIYDGHIQQIFPHGTVDNRTLGRVMAGGEVENVPGMYSEGIYDKVPDTAEEASGPEAGPVRAAQEAAGEAAPEAAPAPAFPAVEAAAGPAAVTAAAVTGAAAAGLTGAETAAAETPAAAAAPETIMEMQQSLNLMQENLKQMQKCLADMQKRLAQMQ